MTDGRPQPRTVVHPTRQVLADAAAARLVTAVVDAQARRGTAHLVLTGGSMGSAILESVGREPGAAAIDWSAVTIWWGDERFLPAGHPDRNETQAREALLDGLPLEPDRVHPMPCSDGPDGDDVEKAAARYGDELADATGGTAPGPTFDVVMLGVGPDCHVASLFPGHPGVAATGTCAVAVRNSPKPPPTRISMTYESLSRSREVWFLVAGQDKAEAVALAHSGAAPREAPATGARGEVATIWLVDAAAASLLTASQLRR